ncbi:hypothetical protein SNL152K_9263 [Streptomyces sp. NL15-2K]|nr:hypothetical protein SNL152K_9263 [Streptomyces sp. NL15-2K]
MQDAVPVDVHVHAGQRHSGAHLYPHLARGQPGAAVVAVRQRHALARVDHRELLGVQPDDEQLPYGTRRFEGRCGDVSHAADVRGDAHVDAGDPGPDHRDGRGDAELDHFVPQLGRAGVGADSQDGDAVLVYEKVEGQQPVAVEEPGLPRPRPGVEQRVIARRLGEAERLQCAVVHGRLSPPAAARPSPG